MSSGAERESDLYGSQKSRYLGQKFRKECQEELKDEKWLLCNNILVEW